MRLRVPSRASLAIGVACLLLATVTGGAVLLLMRDRVATRSTAVTVQNNMALGLEREILRNIDIYDLSLRTASTGLRFLRDVNDPAAQNAILFDGATAARFFRPITIADADGTVVRDGRGGVGAPFPASVAGRPVFEAMRREPDAGLVVTLRTENLRDGQPYLALSRRIRGEDGGFAGIVSGGIDLAFFGDLFSRFNLPEGGSIAFAGYDGRLVARFPPGRTTVGQDLSDSPFVREARAHANADVELVSPMDGVARLATLRRLGDLPFFLSVGTPVATVYGNWASRAWATAAGLLMFAVLSGGLFLSFWRELGRRRRAERTAVAAGEAALLGELRIATYVDCLADGILALRLDPDGLFRFERVNAAAAAMLDVDPNEAINRTALDVWPGPTGSLVETKWRACHGLGDTLRYEQVFETRHGRRVLRFVLAPVPDTGGTGQVTLLLASLRDVTDTVDLEAKLRQSQRMEAVGQLTAGVAHDFNNMLQAQLGALELLMDEMSAHPHALELASMAYSTGQHGARLTHSLLSFSRQQHLVPQAVPVGPLLDRLTLMLTRTLGPQTVVHVEMDAAMASPFADVAQLEAALLNLALNGRDAMPMGGQLRIEARNGGEAGVGVEGAHVMLAVSDTGHGMDPDVAARACEPFFTTKGVGKGSGLGLSMVQGFAQQSGGELRIHSAPGQGTRVELWLPAVVSADTALPAPLSPAACGRGTGRVLLVDDTPDVLSVSAELLENAGFTVVQAAHAEEALILLGTEQPFDVMVTDYMMPGMDGGQLVREARRLHPDLPALVVTGQADVEKLGVLPSHVEVVRKPLSGRALARKVCEILDRRRTVPATE